MKLYDKQYQVWAIHPDEIDIDIMSQYYFPNWFDTFEEALQFGNTLCRDDWYITKACKIDIKEL